MRKLLFVLLSALSLVAVAQNKKTVAVLDPICRDKSVNAFFQQMVRGAMESAVTASSEYEAYDRSAFDQIQKEQAFQRTGAVSDSQIKKMGEMAGVDYVLVSEVSAYEGYLSAVVKILNVTTGKYDKSVDDFMELNPSAVKSKCREMAASMFGKVSSDSRPQSSAKPTVSTQYNNEQVNYSSEELYQKDPSWKENPTITEDCVMKVSSFHEAVKEKRYAEAYTPWLSVYNNCPNANKAIYTDGAKIIDALYQSSYDPHEKKRLANLAIEMLDKRIYYFGNDPRYSTAYIIGEKGLAYLDYFGEEQYTQARACLAESARKQGKKSKIRVLVKLVDCSYAIYKKTHNAKQFIADYELASSLLSEQASDPSNKNAEVAGKQKDYVDNIFAIFGAADCSKLDEIYAAVVQENLNSLDMLQKLAKIYKRVRCTESDVYFAACEAAHKLQPTAESAAGCASMSAKKGDYEQAVAYYDQAIKQATANGELEDVADYQYSAALYNFANLKRYQEARKYALASIQTLSGLGITKGQGRCYIIIGMCYASSRPYGNDATGAILNKTVYWAAVDKFVKAKQVDSSVEAVASEYIETYSKYFPTKEERFGLPNEFSGSTFYVGGWIGETTYIR